MGKVLLAFALSLAVAAAAVRIEKTDYHGWKNTYRITNGTVELLVVTDVGPRILSYRFTGGRNIFKESENQWGKSGERTWQGRGGHRLWVAPEKVPDTYALDNAPVGAEVRSDTLVVTEAAEKETGMRKRMVIRMAPTGTGVTIVHEITNQSGKPRLMAPWALTQMAPGGVGILGFPARPSHRESLAPTNPLTMWGYTDFTDPRWKILKKYLILRQDPTVASAQKGGVFNPATFAAYLLGTDLFIKRTQADASKTYPDFGCSVEAYADAGIEELETLGPMVTLEPDATVQHTETWSLHQGVSVPQWTDEALDRVLVPLLQ